MRITKQEARRLALRAQGLDGSWSLSPGKVGVAEVVERLGYVQIDTISVVQRAHHHTVWSRHGGTRVGMLYDLLADHDRVFEYWTHAASYIPLSDYRYYIPRMKAFSQHERHVKIMSEHSELAQHILDRIRAEGPLGSADFKPPEGFESGTWWNWKPSKRVLEALFSAGALMISGRRGFQRLYDLTERVLPAHVDTSEPSAEEARRFHARRILSAHGVVSHMAFRRRIRRPAFEAIMGDWIGAGEVLALEVEGSDPTYYALSEQVAQLASLPEPPELVHILSPFDNATIWRDRLEALFDFDYSLECYVPKAKRVHGYFVLPVLWGDRFVARLDAKADRKPRTLILRQLALASELLADGSLEAFLPSFASKLAAFAAFNDCDRLQIESVLSKTCLEPVQQALSTVMPTEVV